MRSMLAEQVLVVLVLAAASGSVWLPGPPRGVPTGPDGPGMRPFDGPPGLALARASSPTTGLSLGGLLEPPAPVPAIRWTRPGSGAQALPAPADLPSLD